MQKPEKVSSLQETAEIFVDMIRFIQWRYSTDYPSGRTMTIAPAGDIPYVEYAVPPTVP